MYFRRINDNTINCIISPEDLNENGIALDDLFERKPAAMDYLKSVVLEAAQKENFNLNGQYTSMRITVLPDHSISLTLTDGTDESAQTKRPHIPVDDPASKIKGVRDQKGSSNAGSGRTVYGFVFRSMEDVITCSAHLKAAESVSYQSDLYQNARTGEYYLLLEKNDGHDTAFDKLAFSLNEFGTLINEGPERLAYIKEHERCIVKGNAVETLAAVTD
ncbi:MAG: adaptor protein MecA [Lachnospiraceae bacterium]|nr:adaptor protein MecA [Lachnospiraceae bacterium]